MKTAFQYQYILELSTFKHGCFVGLHMIEGKVKRERGGGIDEEPVSDKPLLIRCGEN